MNIYIVATRDESQWSDDELDREDLWVGTEEDLAYKMVNNLKKTNCTTYLSIWNGGVLISEYFRYFNKGKWERNCGEVNERLELENQVEEANLID
jgi:hypothetical protein